MIILNIILNISTDAKTQPQYYKIPSSNRAFSRISMDNNPLSLEYADQVKISLGFPFNTNTNVFEIHISKIVYDNHSIAFYWPLVKVYITAAFIEFQILLKNNIISKINQKIIP